MEHVAHPTPRKCNNIADRNLPLVNPVLQEPVGLGPLVVKSSREKKMQFY